MPCMSFDNDKKSWFSVFALTLYPCPLVVVVFETVAAAAVVPFAEVGGIIGIPRFPS